MWLERKLIVCAASIAFAGCASGPRRENLFERLAREDQACAAEGGNPARAAHFIASCEWPATDAGKACSDNKECEGRCDPPMEPPDPTPGAIQVLKFRLPESGPIVGTCSSYRTRGKPLNCTFYLVKGRIEGGHCID
jgi:hypothetical protein